MMWALLIGIFGGACIVASVRIITSRVKDDEHHLADEFEIIEDDI